MLLNRNFQLSQLSKAQSHRGNSFRQLVFASVRKNFFASFGKATTSPSTKSKIFLGRGLFANTLKILCYNFKKRITLPFGSYKPSNQTKRIRLNCAEFNVFIKNQSQSFLKLLSAFIQNIRVKTCQSFVKSASFFSSSATITYLSRTSLTASIGLINWDEHNISNEEIKKEVNEILTLFGIDNEKASANEKTSKKINFTKARTLETDEWKLIYNEKDLLIWRRSINLSDIVENTSENDASYDLFEYKVLGRMNDITPLDFFQTQLDLEYRKKWDHLVISLDTIEKHNPTNTELIRWIMYFPYPLFPREYIFVRRYCLVPNERLLVLISRCLSENHFKYMPDKKEKKEYVRVNNYKSNMIVIPHTEFDKIGCDYIIQYYDINKAKIPKLAYTWMASSGLPDYIRKLHKATLKQKEQKQIYHKHDNTTYRPDHLISQLDVFDLKETIKDELTTSSVSVEDSYIVNNANTELEVHLNESLNSVKILENNEKIIPPQTNEIAYDSTEAKSFYEVYLLLVIKKLNDDYFENENEYEKQPHPIFFHYY